MRGIKPASHGRFTDELQNNQTQYVNHEKRWAIKFLGAVVLTTFPHKRNNLIKSTYDHSKGVYGLRSGRCPGEIKYMMKWTPEKFFKSVNAPPWNERGKCETDGPERSTGNKTPKNKQKKTMHSCKASFLKFNQKDSFHSWLYLIRKKKPTPSWVRCSFNQTQRISLESYYLWNVELTNVTYMSDVKAFIQWNYLIFVCMQENGIQENPCRDY